MTIEAYTPAQLAAYLANEAHRARSLQVSGLSSLDGGAQINNGLAADIARIVLQVIVGGGVQILPNTIQILSGVDVPGGFLGGASSAALGSVTSIADYGGTVTVTVAANRRLIILATYPQVAASVTGSFCTFYIREGGVTLQFQQQELGGNYTGTTIFADVKPTAGAHTYKGSLQSGIPGTYSVRDDGGCRLIVFDVGT